MSRDLIERLIADAPRFHFISEEHARKLSGILRVPVQAGPASHAVPASILRYFADSVSGDHLIAETGSGYSTVALAALAKHHTCVTDDGRSVELIKEYMARVGIPAEKVTFIVGDSDRELPKLPRDQWFDFVFLDGEHSFPYPTIDWHYLDLRLKVGGILGVDNTEIPPVYDLCVFLAENKSTTSFVGSRTGGRVAGTARTSTGSCATTSATPSSSLQFSDPRAARRCRRSWRIGGGIGRRSGRGTEGSIPHPTPRPRKAYKARPRAAVQPALLLRRGVERHLLHGYPHSEVPHRPLGLSGNN